MYLIKTILKVKMSNLLGVHLNGLKTVAVITEDPGEFHLPDLV